VKHSTQAIIGAVNCRASDYWRKMMFRFVKFAVLGIAVTGTAAYAAAPAAFAAACSAACMTACAMFGIDCGMPNC
jgi:hypothetical protein